MNNNNGEDNVLSLQQTMLGNREALGNLNENIISFNKNILKSLSLQDEIIGGKVEKPEEVKREDSNLKESFEEFKKILEKQTEIFEKYFGNNVKGSVEKRGTYEKYVLNETEMIETSAEMEKQYKEKGLNFLTEKKLPVGEIKTGLATIYEGSKMDEWQDLNKKGMFSKRSKLDKLLDKQIEYYEEEQKRLEDKIKENQDYLKSLDKDRDSSNMVKDIVRKGALEEIESDTKKRENLEKDSLNIKSLKNSDFNYNGERNRVELTPRKNNKVKQESKEQKPKQAESEKLKQTESENRKLEDVKEIKKEVKSLAEIEKMKQNEDKANFYLLILEGIIFITLWFKEKFPNAFKTIMNVLSGVLNIFKKVFNFFENTFRAIFSSGIFRKMGINVKSRKELEEEKEMKQVEEAKTARMTMADGRNNAEHFEENTREKMKPFFGDDKDVGYLRMNTPKEMTVISGGIGESIPDKSPEEISADKKHADNIGIQKETAKEIKQSISTKGDTNVVTSNYISIPKPSATDKLLK
jgi:hypothetical protein